MECGKRPDWRGLSLHHKKKRSQGGKTSVDNCILICGSCHSMEHGIREVGDNKR
jgi:5-methylcytosine-specific restriction endonuclease McrA